MKKVSIGLPVFNGEAYLRQALDSLVAQTYQNIEILISDNASTDGTQSIAMEFAASDGRIRYERLKSNVGAAPNFNRLFHRTDGDYFKWAAHDDMCRPTFVERCVEILEAESDAVLCHSESEILLEDGSYKQFSSKFVGADANDPISRFRNLLLSDHLCLDVFGVIRRSALVGTPLIGHYIGSDRVLLAELGLKGRLRRVPDSLFLSRDHPARSIRSMRLRERASWFNSNHKGRIVLPYWRNAGEYSRMIVRSNLGLGVRLRCLALMARWGIQNREFLIKDISHAADVGVRKLKPTSRTQ